MPELIGYQDRPKHCPDRTGDMRYSVADITLAGRCRGYAPMVDFRAVLERTVTWYRTRGASDREACQIR